ncbi:MAG TPA: hypothetical protein VHK69_22185 [Chitinophagaceae bacterium]|nr:hypothetical protein [Chitinophagaceae bacterium]
MKACILLCASLCAFLTLRAQPETLFYSGAAAYRRLPADAFAVRGHAAAPATGTDFQLGFWGGRLFGLEAFPFFRAGCTIPLKRGAASLHADHTGNGPYREGSAAAGYALPLGKRWQGGLLLHYTTGGARGEKRWHQPSARAGVLYHTSLLTLGAQWEQGVARTVQGEAVRPGNRISAGLGYAPGPGFWSGVRAAWDINDRLTVEGGLSYRPHPRLWLEGFWLPAADTFLAATGFGWKGYRVEARLALHGRMGITPGIALLYQKEEVL